MVKIESATEGDSLGYDENGRWPNKREGAVVGALQAVAHGFHVRPTAPCVHVNSLIAFDGR